MRNDGHRAQLVHWACLRMHLKAKQQQLAVSCCNAGVLLSQGIKTDLVLGLPVKVHTL